MNDLRAEQLLRLQVPFRLNHTSPQANGLLGWWPAEYDYSGGEFLNDHSGYNNHGFLFQRPSPAGTYGRANGMFVTSGFAVDCGTAIPFDGENLTMFLDYTLLPGFSSAICRHMAYYDPTIWNDSGTWAVVVGGGISFTFTPDPTPANYMRIQWHLTRKGSEVNLYQNGRRVYNNTGFGSTWSKNGNVFLARGNGFIEETPCIIHEARVYNRGMAEDEITAMLNPSTRYELFAPLGSLDGLIKVPIVESTGSRSQVIMVG